MMEISAVRNAWDGIAVNFDRYVTPTANWVLAKTVLRLAGLKSGMDFLDVASGSGALSLPAARLGANVLAVDISPTMIERLKARAAEEGLSNLKGCAMDGHQLELPDNAFDMAGSQFGVMLFPDFMRGLHEMIRITRPGGKVFLVTFGPVVKVEFLVLFIQAIKMVVADFNAISTDAPPLPFQVSGDGVLQRKMKKAGLHKVQVLPVVHKLSFHTGMEMWNWVTSSNPIALQMISGLNDDQKNQVIQSLEGVIRKRSDGKDSAVLEVAVNVGIGEKI